MKSCEELRRQHLERCNRLRRIQRIINLSEFCDAWQTLTSEESRSVEAMIALGQATELQAWLDKKCRKSLDDMTLSELREQARRHSIPYYAQMNKMTLVWEISNAIDGANAGRNGSACQVGQVAGR